MEAKAIGRYLRVPPRKARLVLDAIRGKSASEALAILKFTPNEAARYIEKILHSAMANAENNFAMDRDALRVVTIYSDTGPSMKRIQPRSMGRAYRIIKRTSHITVIVAEDEKLKAAAKHAKPAAAKHPTRRKATADAAPAAAKPSRAKKPAVEQPAEKTSAAKAPAADTASEQE